MGAGGSRDSGGDDPVERIMREAPPDQMLASVRDLPFPKGHPMLARFADALEAEYVQQRGPMVGNFLDGLSEARDMPGVRPDDFNEWVAWVEALIRVSYEQRRGIITMDQLRAEWGLAQAAGYAHAQPATAVAQPATAVAQPAYAQAGPAVAVATAVPAGGYPQATPAGASAYPQAVPADPQGTPAVATAVAYPA